MWYMICVIASYTPVTISRLPLSCWSFIAVAGKGLYFMNRMIALGDLMKLGQILRLQYFFWIHIQKVIFPAVIISYTAHWDGIMHYHISRCKMPNPMLMNIKWLYMMCIVYDALFYTMFRGHKPKLLQNFAN